MIAALFLPASLAAQTPGADSTARTTAAAAPASTPTASAPNPARASWLSDRRPLRVGDILTIVVDEQTRARERVSTVATANRSQGARLNAGVDSAIRIGPHKQFGTAHESNSRDVGDAVRDGDLTAVLSVRVVELDRDGNARISGRKTVTVDGRNQEIAVEGVIRPDDVTSENLVSSSRIAEATISYKGKKIGPRQGILGKILAILWP